MKIKEKLLNLLKELRESIKKFPVTIVAIYTLTLILTVGIGRTNTDWGIIGRISVFTIIFASTTYLIETLITEKKVSKIIYYIVSAIGSIVLTILLFTKNSILGMSNELFIHYLISFTVCYVATVLILSIYFNFKKTGKSFEEYCTKVEISIFKTSIIYGVLALGGAIIALIFIYLILNGRGYILLGRIEILLVGLYYIPMLIYTLHSQSDEIGKFAKVMKYVLGTLVMIAFAIIYIYILKIIVLRNIPSNQIFRILAALFIIGLPIWTICNYFNEGKIFDKINEKLPLLFIPFIFLQMYSIGVRIGNNGFTEPRYLCIMLIAFEIIYTIIYIKNKSNIGNSLLVIVALTVISTTTPFVNMFRVSAISQYNILKKYSEQENLTSEEKSKLRGAYSYLNRTVLGEQYLENNIDKNKVLDLMNGDDDETLFNNEIHIYANNDVKSLNIEGYQKLNKVSAPEYKLVSPGDYGSSNNSNKIESVFSNVEFVIAETEETVSVNMLDLVKKYIQLGNSLDDNFEKLNEIVIDNDRKIILDYVSISYTEETNEVDNYRLSGYLLTK